VLPENLLFGVKGAVFLDHFYFSDRGDVLSFVVFRFLSSAGKNK